MVIVSVVWRASWIVAEKMCAIQTAAIASESRPRKSWGRATATRCRGIAGTIARAGSGSVQDRFSALGLNRT
jgi:hypothetical protein